MPELLDIAALLENTARVKSYGRREGGEVTRDTLDDLFDAAGTPDSSLHGDPPLHHLGRRDGG